jgi:hypothetical protein
VRFTTAGVGQIWGGSFLPSAQALVITVASAQAPTASELYYSGGSPNGRFWSRRTQQEKIVWLAAYSDDVDGRFQRDVNGHSGHVNKVGAQRRWDYNHARHLRD